MAGDDDGGIGQGQKLVMDGAEEGGGVAAGEVRSADGAGEEGVTGDQDGVVWEVETDAALGVAGGVEDVGGDWRFG